MSSIFLPNYRLFGANPVGWHVTLILLHLLAVWLVYKIAERLTGEFEIALISAMLFGLLPVHAESLAWPAAVDMSLAGTLELVAFYQFMAGGPQQFVSWSALLPYGGALLSHESAITFPALLALYVFLLESPAGAPALKVRLRLAIARVLPFVVEVFVFLAVHKLAVGAITSPPPGYHMTTAQALTSVPEALATYAMLLVVPWKAGPAHRLLPPASIGAVGFWMPATLVIAALALAVVAIMNSPRRRLYWFCAGWMAVAIAPAMNMSALRFDMVVQDRYLYLPSLGWCLMATTVLIGFARRDFYRRLVWAGTAAWLLVCAASLWSTLHYWHDDLTMSRRGIEKFPEAAIWHGQMGLVLQGNHDLPGAVRELEQWRSLTGDFLHRHEGSRFLQDLGLLYARLGRNREAEIELGRGLQLDPDAPAAAYTKLAELYDLDGDQQRSEAILKLAESRPDGAQEVAMMRVRIAARHGDTIGAEKALRDLTGRYPDDQRVWTMLGLLMADQNRNDEALAALQHAIDLKPHDARPYFYAAKLLRAKGHNRQALDDCRLALQIDPYDPGAASLMSQIARATPQH